MPPQKKKQPINESLNKTTQTDDCILRRELGEIERLKSIDQSGGGADHLAKDILLCRQKAMLRIVENLSAENKQLKMKYEKSVTACSEIVQLAKSMKTEYETVIDNVTDDLVAMKSEYKILHTELITHFKKHKDLFEEKKKRFKNALSRKDRQNDELKNELIVADQHLGCAITALEVEQRKLSIAQKQAFNYSEQYREISKKLDDKLFLTANQRCSTCTATSTILTKMRNEFTEKTRELEELRNGYTKLEQELQNQSRINTILTNSIERAQLSEKAAKEELQAVQEGTKQLEAELSRLKKQCHEFNAQLHVSNKNVQAKGFSNIVTPPEEESTTLPQISISDSPNNSMNANTSSDSCSKISLKAPLENKSQKTVDPRAKRKQNVKMISTEPAKIPQIAVTSGVTPSDQPPTFQQNLKSLNKAFSNDSIQSLAIQSKTNDKFSSQNVEYASLTRKLPREIWPNAVREGQPQLHMLKKNLPYVTKSGSESNLTVQIGSDLRFSATANSPVYFPNNPENNLDKEQQISKPSSTSWRRQSEESGQSPNQFSQNFKRHLDGILFSNEPQIKQKREVKADVNYLNPPLSSSVHLLNCVRPSLTLTTAHLMTEQAISTLRASQQRLAPQRPPSAQKFQHSPYHPVTMSRHATVSISPSKLPWHTHTHQQEHLRANTHPRYPHQPLAPQKHPAMRVDFEVPQIQRPPQIQKPPQIQRPPQAPNFFYRQ